MKRKRDSYFIQSLTAKSVKGNLGTQNAELLKRWKDCFDDIASNKIDNVDLYLFFKEFIESDSSHLRAFRAISKINSAFNNAIEPEQVSNHLNTIRPNPKGYYTQQELADKLDCDRGELSELLKMVGLDKQSLKKAKKKGLSIEDAVIIKHVLKNHKNKEKRAAAFDRMKSKKSLTVLKEDDLFIHDSKKLAKTTHRTGIFD